jgi:hypothetical protein
VLVATLGRVVTGKGHAAASAERDGSGGTWASGVQG